MLRMDLMTCSPAMPGNSLLGPFKSSCNEYLLFFFSVVQVGFMALTD